jgi:hypothetical protein
MFGGLEPKSETPDLPHLQTKSQSVRNESPTKRNLLGELTIYRINKEFENF